MSGIWPFSGDSIYASTFSYFWPGRRRLSREIARALEKADIATKTLLGQQESFIPSDRFAPDQLIARHYDELFLDFAKAAVICLGGSLARDREIRLIVGIVSFIFGAGSVLSIGKFWSDHLEFSEEEARVNSERKTLLPRFKQYDSPNRDMFEIRRILRLEEELFSKIRQHAVYTLVIRIGIFVTSVFGMLSVVTTSYSFLSLALSLGTPMTIGWLISNGFSFSTREQIHTAQNIQRHLGDLHSRTLF